MEAMCDVDGWPDFYSEKRLVARKEHRCCACQETIRRGDTYVRIAGAWDGEFASFKQCIRCSAIMHGLGALTDNDEGVDIELNCGADPLDPGSPLDRLAFFSRDDAQTALGGEQ